MKKFIKYLMAVMLVSALLMSCEKEGLCKYKGVNGCICILRNANGEALYHCGKTLETSEMRNIVMYPNPASSRICLYFQTVESRTVIIKNTWGKKFYNQTINDLQILIDISDYPKGTYLVIVDDGNQKSKLCLFKDVE
jgi:hypothetical protein